MIQQTSIEAYHEVRLAQNQAIVFSCFERYGGMTNNEVARKLGWGINCVTPRVFELRNMGLLVEAGWKRDWVSRRRCVVWKKKS